ncbi:MAG: hypothetical protein NC405_06325 [Odoribacter sp.]|nr:hypothetical protein [Odoribacter sp.]
MKKALLFLTFLVSYLISSASVIPLPGCDQTSDNRSKVSTAPLMVVEGRTWWYETYHNGPQFHYWQFGVSIGKEVEIDGVKWHELNVTLSAEKDYLDAATPDLANWKFDDTERCVSYIREDDNDVYILYTPEKFANFNYFEYQYSAGSFWAIDEETNECTALLYHFGEVGEQFTLGNDIAPKQLEIKAVDEVISNGISYRQYSYNKIDEDYFIYWPVEELYTCVEGIGYLTDMHGDELFFGPIRQATTAYPQTFPTRLNYVTDASGEIIFTQAGGTRLWDLYKAVDEITADSSEGTPRWYNLQGVEIPKPSAPGIYIKVEGRQAVKFAID